MIILGQRSAPNGENSTLFSPKYTFQEGEAKCRSVDLPSLRYIILETFLGKKQPSFGEVP